MGEDFQEEGEIAVVESTVQFSDCEISTGNLKLEIQSLQKDFIVSVWIRSH